MIGVLNGFALNDVPLAGLDVISELESPPRVIRIGLVGLLTPRASLAGLRSPRVDSLGIRTPSAVSGGLL